MKCDFCGQVNPDKARFCMQCGKDFHASKKDNAIFEYVELDSFTPAGSLEELPLSQDKKNPEAVSEKGDKLSLEEEKRQLENPDVGLLMGKPEKELEKPPEIYQPEASKHAAENKRFCSLCGHGSPADSKYCFNCGAPLDTEETNNHLDPEGDIPLAPIEEYDLETSTLAPLRPSLDEALPAVKEKKKIKVKKQFKWGIQEWIAAIIVICAAGFAVWFFLLGGSNAFTFEAKKIRQAGATMENLNSFVYISGGTVEVRNAGVYRLSGEIKYKKPWTFEILFSFDHPQKGPLTYHQIRINDTLYLLKNNNWLRVKTRPTIRELTGLWKEFSSIENMGRKTINGKEFHNYRYRVPARNLTRMFGINNPEAVSDTVVEVLIDTTSLYIQRINAVLYNFDIEGEKSTLRLVFDLASIEQPVKIETPIQESQSKLKALQHVFY